MTITDSDDNLVTVPTLILKLLYARSWTLAVVKSRENRAAVQRLEYLLLSQWIDFKKNPSPVYNLSTLNTSLCGFVCDSGIRNKTICPDSVNTRCGECSFNLSNDVPYGFLDFGRIIETVAITPDNWNQYRLNEAPKVIALWKEVFSVGLITYDNLHNICGHIRDLFCLLIDLMPAKLKPDVEERLQKIIKKVPFDFETDQPRKAPHNFFQGFEWRKLSLHFMTLFKDLWIDNTILSFPIGSFSNPF